MKLDVLHVLPDLAVGGAEGVAVELLRHAAAGGRLAAAAVCLGAPRHTPLEAQLARDGVPVWFLGKARGASPRCAAQLHRLVRQCRPALLHTHLHVMPYVLPTLTARRGLACVHTVHNLAGHETRGLTRLAQRLAYRLGATPVAISHAVRRSLRAVYGLRAAPLIPNGIALERVQAEDGARERVRAALELPADAVVFACLARLAPQKNHAGLLDAFAQGPGGDPRAHLLICGDGPLRASLEQRARELSLARVRFLGERHDVANLLAAADAVVLASHWEGSPLTVMEAMAAGKPVVATAVGGVPELIQDRRTGLLVPPRQPRALAFAMRHLLNEPTLRQRLATAATQTARHRFDSTLMARRYQSLYTHLTKKGSDPFIAALGEKNGSDPFLGVKG